MFNLGCLFLAVCTTGCNGADVPKERHEGFSSQDENESSLVITEENCKYSTQSVQGNLVKLFEYKNIISGEKFKEKVVLVHSELHGLKVDTQDFYIDQIQNEEVVFFYQLGSPQKASVEGNQIKLIIPKEAGGKLSGYGVLNSCQAAVEIRLSDGASLVAVVVIYLND